MLTCGKNRFGQMSAAYFSWFTTTWRPCSRGRHSIGKRQQPEARYARHNGGNVVRQFVVLLGFWAILTLTSAHATVDDAISRALEAFEPHVKQGYVLRWDDQWGGDLGVKDRKAIPQTLFRGNDYWFCMGTDVDRARVTVHVYDSNGKLADSDAWQKGWSAAVRTLIQTTGRYYVIVEVTSSPAERTHWAMVHGSKRIGLQKEVVE